MPQYDFRCTECEQVFSLERPLGYLEPESCPECGATAHRVFEVFKNPPAIGGGSCACDSKSDLDTTFEQLTQSV